MGGRGSRPLSQKQVEEKRQMAVLHGEVEAMGDMFMRMNRQCYEKCINPSVSEGRGTGTDDLSLDDENCVAICTAKFVGTQQRVMDVFMAQAQESGDGPMPGQPGYQG